MAFIHSKVVREALKKIKIKIMGGEMVYMLYSIKQCLGSENFEKLLEK
jgi:hypothetical protein